MAQDEQAIATVPRYNLSQTDPQLIQDIIALRRQGLSIAQVAKQLSTSRETIRTVELTHPLPFQELKRALAKRYTQAASQALEDYQEALDKGVVNSNMLPLHSCQLMDKSLALMGEASTIHRVEVTRPELDTLLDSMPVIEVTSSKTETGLNEVNSNSESETKSGTSSDTGTNIDEAK